MSTPELENLNKKVDDIRARIINIERKIDLVLQNNVKLDADILDSVMDTRDQSYGSRLFSQNGEEIVVLNILRSLGQRKGSYLDIGANDPINISNTALLYQMGWRGVNVEPNPAFIKAFQTQRPEDVNLNVGVAANSGSLTYYMFGERSGLNTFSRSQAEEIAKGSTFSVIKTMEIPVVTIGQIVTDHCKGVFPDILFVDVEGMDLEILQSVNLRENFPKLICVEANNADIKKTLVDYLESRDYVLVFVAGVNLFFLRRELYPKMRD